MFLFLVVSALAQTAERPQWLLDYVDFHRRSVSNERAPKLIYHCEVLCGGLSDRLKGVILAFYAAIVTQRVLLIHMRSPDIVSMVVPNEIDWRTNDAGADPKCDVMHIDIDVTARWVASISNRHDPWGRETRIACVRLNVYADTIIRTLLNSSPIFAESIDRPNSAFVGTAFRALFRPGDVVRARFNALMREHNLPVPTVDDDDDDRDCYICPSRGPLWIATHVRTGDAAFIHADYRYSIDRMATLIRCLNEMNAGGNITTYVASDSAHTKRALASLVAGAAYSEVPIAHFEFQSAADHSWTWAEFFLIAHAPCVVTVRYSGFSMLAAFAAERFDDAHQRCFIMQPTEERCAIGDHRV